MTGRASRRLETTIRLAGEADLPQLSQLVIAFRDHLQADRPSEAELASYLPGVLSDPGVEFCLAVSGGAEGLGYTQCRFHPSIWSSGPIAHLEDLFVTESARRHGLGRELLSFAFERASGRGAGWIGLHTNERNEPAQAFYRSAGFEPESERRWQGGREIYWVRRIGPR